MIFGLPRKLGGAFSPLKMHHKGCVIVAPLETLREIENRYNYISLKKELEKKTRWGGKSRGCAIVAPLESLER